MYKLVQSASGT